MIPGISWWLITVSPLRTSVTQRPFKTTSSSCHSPAGLAAFLEGGDVPVNASHVSAVGRFSVIVLDLDFVTPTEIDPAVASFRTVHFDVELEVFEVVSRVNVGSTTGVDQNSVHKIPGGCIPRARLPPFHSPGQEIDRFSPFQIGSGGESGSRLSLPRERLPLGFSGAFQSSARGMPFQFEAAAAEVNPMAVRRHPLHRSGMPTTRLEAAFETVFDLLQLKPQRIPCISLRRRDIPSPQEGDSHLFHFDYLFNFIPLF